MAGSWTVRNVDNEILPITNILSTVFKPCDVIDFYKPGVCECIVNCDHVNIDVNVLPVRSPNVTESCASEVYGANQCPHDVPLENRDSITLNDEPESINVTPILTQAVNVCNSNNVTVLESLDEPFTQLSEFSKKYHKQMIFSHLNVNGLSGKYAEIHEILRKGLTDMLFLSETKLDCSYPNPQFHINSYVTHRQDRNAHGGGLACYVRETIPHKHRPDIAVNQNGIESIVIQVKTKTNNSFFIVIYKPPNIHIQHLSKAIESMLNKCLSESRNIYIIGDLNVNFNLNPNNLSNICDIYDLKQVIKGPTCFKSLENPTLLDIILTNSPNTIKKTINVALGISDFHNYISAATRMSCPSNEPKLIQYRSFKKFNENDYLNDLQVAPFHVSQTFEDVDDQLWFHNTLLLDIIDKNAPQKQRIVKCNQLPYMNDNLRKAINVKASLRRKFNKNRSQVNWEKFRKQRNLVNKLKKTSLQKYFNDKCNDSNNKGKHFWQVVKPFMTNKSKANNQNITLYENDSLVTDSTDISNIFNEYFINVANDLKEADNVTDMSTDEVIDYYKEHPSIKSINNHVDVNQFFHFKNIENSTTSKKLKNLQINKASGFDNISPKFLKLSANHIGPSLTTIINNSIKATTFPDYNKRAEITPLYKKSDQLAKENYRPLSILTSTSKIFEMVMCDQIIEFVASSLSLDLSAYRKTYSCNNVLVKCVENWRKALDNNCHVGCILIDLSKAFDSIPHGLLIAKLHAYGMSNEACTFISDYLKQRKQIVKLGNIKSKWLNLKTGVPQGSILGPLLFNIFINDFLFELNNLCDVYNYADDNTLSFSHKDPKIIKDKLEKAATCAISWFKGNFMQANASKFQAICISRQNITIDYAINDNIIKSEKCVKLLGINIDDKLNFDNHVSQISKKAGRQINALLRICKKLDYTSRLRIYESFIYSNFVYCTVVYNNFTAGQNRKLEKLNERALRLVCNDYDNSYSCILKRTCKRMLYVTRKYNLVEFVYKVLHDQARPIESTFFTEHITPYEMRDRFKLAQPRYNTVQYGQKSISYQGASMWNSLPVRLKDVGEFVKFKDSLRNSNVFDHCNCGFCLICQCNNL